MTQPADARRDDSRHAGLHEPRAGARPGRGQADRHLGVRVRALRDADGQESVRWRARSPTRSPGFSSASPSGPRCRRRRPDRSGTCSTLPAQGSGERLRDIADARIEIDECDLSAASTEQTAGDRAARVRAARLTWTAAILGLITVASVATVAVLLLKRPASPSTAISMDPVALTIVPPSGATFGNRLVRFAVSPDGRQIVFSASVGTRSSLWVRPIAAEEYKEIAGTDGAIFPFWKPDSKEIGFFAGGKLKRVALGGVPCGRVRRSSGSRSGRRRNLES